MRKNTMKNILLLLWVSLNCLLVMFFVWRMIVPPENYWYRVYYTVGRIVVLVALGSNIIRASRHLR